MLIEVLQLGMHSIDTINIFCLGDSNKRTICSSIGIIIDLIYINTRWSKYQAGLLRTYDVCKNRIFCKFLKIFLEFDTFIYSYADIQTILYAIRDHTYITTVTRLLDNYSERLLV